jgi:hypothetical protein
VRKEVVVGLKLQLANAEAAAEVAEAASRAAARRACEIEALARAMESKAANEAADMKRRLFEVTKLLEGEAQKRKRAESKAALGAYVHAMLAGTAPAEASAGADPSSRSSSGRSGSSGGPAGSLGAGCLPSTTLQRQASLGVASRVCSLDEVVAVQQRLLDELRAGKAAAERRLAEALRAVSVTVSVDGGGVNRAADTRDTANTSGGRSSNNPFSRDRDTTPAGGETPVSQGEEDEDEEGEEEEDDDFDIAAVSLAEAAVGAAGGETSAGVYASGDASSGSGNEHEPPPGAMKRQRPPEVEYPVLAFGSRGAAPCASSGEAAAAEATRGAADEKSRGLAASSASGGSEQRVCKQCTLLNGSTAKSCGVRQGGG